MSQFDLAQVISQNWPTLEAHYGKSQISLSRPVAAPGRALRTISPFRDLNAIRVGKMRRARYTLKADINHFYGSIYTHSLEWALHTKAFSKAQLGASGSAKVKLLGSAIDLAVRNTQDRQTKGIAVGPDTSLALAEIISCAIDQQIQKASLSVRKFSMRYIDDFEFFCRTRSEAEDVLYRWESELGQYDLALNTGKTNISEGPLPHERTWPARLLHYSFRKGGDSLLRNDLLRFLTLCFEISQDHRSDAVLTYALTKVVNLFPVSDQVAKVIQDVALASAVAEASSLPVVYQILIRAHGDGNKLNRAEIAQTLSELCVFHAPLEHGSEVSWSLYILSSLKLKLSAAAAKTVAGMRDNCCLILLQDMVAAGLVSGAGPDLSNAVARAEAGGVWRSEDWLLGYEFARNGWADPKEFKGHPAWAMMMKADVAFFNRSSTPRFVTLLPVTQISLSSITY